MTGIVDTGVGNIASVTSAFRALGTDSCIVSSPADLKQATRIVLPGVGSFGAGINCLKTNHLDAVLKKQIDRGVPVLAICLGMQMLTEGSEEAPGLPGLGVIPGICTELPESVRKPQQGWNLVRPDSASSLLQEGYAAFANSFVLPDAGAEWAPARTDYGTRFVSAVNRDNVLACQFHPELSGKYGLDLIRRWLRGDIGSNRAASSISVSSPRMNNAVVRIIPCLDVLDGSVVKGVRFQNLQDAGDPATRAALYEEQGADEIVFLDIAASPRGLKTRLDTVRRVRNRVHIPLTVGGGIQSVDDARRLLESGADKISINSAAVRMPELISDLARAFGRQCVVVAIDARRVVGSASRLTHAENGPLWQVLVQGGRVATDLDVREWAVKAEAMGAGELLLTSWDRDGTQGGADLELVRTVSSSSSIPVICSGGIGEASDVLDAILSGADAVLAASIFHNDMLSVSDLKRALANKEVSIRL